MRVLAATLVLTSGSTAALEPQTVLLRPPGTYANLDTHRLYYYCLGPAQPGRPGTPTVVVDAGLGGSALEWQAVQETLSAHVRVCTYDRAGYGWSDPGPSPRDARQVVSELRQLLVRAGEAPPFILVGHSLGGFHVRYFAARHPADVAAIVLIESSHPGHKPERVTAHDSRRHGIDINRVAPPPPHWDRHRRAARFLNSRRKALFAQMDELSNFAASAEQVLAAGDLPPVPLAVLARDASSGADAAREERWRAAQESLAGLRPDGRLVVIAGSDHNVHLTRPGRVVAAILEIVRQLDSAALANR